jgi:8-oxo-dGTP pyrophosphatase MutT (NUDIX family)
MDVVCAGEKPPATFRSSIFLAGPSPRAPTDPNWRPEALRLLEALGYEGVVFVPLPRGGGWTTNYEDQVGWEHESLNMSDVVVFWVPRSEALPAFTTNVEFGMYYNSGKAVLGYPPGALKMRYLQHLSGLESVPRYATLEETLAYAVSRCGSGGLRSGGERCVPLHIWNLPSFQGWVKALRSADNRLDGAKLLWSFRVGPRKTSTFAYALQVKVWVAAEERHKTNEFILARPDISVVVAYRPAPRLENTEVVLIREFRSPARTHDGYIYEAPGGSSWKPDEDAQQVAAHELEEETGLSVEPARLRPLGSRQVCGTFSTHHAHLFAVEVTEAEMERLKGLAGQTFGVAEDSEQTTVEVHTVGELLHGGPFSDPLVDWSMLGMIVAAVAPGE